MSGAARTLPGLAAEVEVWRDPWGIPHIRASRVEDAFFGLGYVHATDRLWQMDANRRRAVGRFAEWAGPAALPFDLLARRLGGEAASRRDAAALGAEARAMLHAYAAGVNAFIAQGALPAEYALLGEAPEPWQDWHAIAAMRHASLMLNSVYPKLWRALALPVVGPHQLGKLRMDGGGEEMVCMPPGAVTQREGPPLDALAGAMAELLRTASPDAAGGGSNNWVLAGSRTASGRPLLAGDPHRMLDMPNLYYQCHLACHSASSASDGFDVIRPHRARRARLPTLRPQPRRGLGRHGSLRRYGRPVPRALRRRRAALPRTRRRVARDRAARGAGSGARPAGGGLRDRRDQPRAGGDR